jgi:hypothetical protein
MSHSHVFQNIDPPPPSPPGECVPPPPPTKAGGTHKPGGEGGGGSIFWKTRDIGLASYSNNLSTLSPIIAIFLCPNCLRRMATSGPLPRLRNTIIELVMAASVLPDFKGRLFIYLFIYSNTEAEKHCVYGSAGVDYNLTLCLFQS